MPIPYFRPPKGYDFLRRTIGRFWISLWLVLGLLWPVLAEETYTFDPAEIEKKPYHFGGYGEIRPVLFGTDSKAAFYKLRFFDDPQEKYLMEWNGRLQLEGRYDKGLFALFGKMNGDLKNNWTGFSHRATFYEAYGTIKPSLSLKIDLGKRTAKWGKGYAWNPVAFADRPKDPDEPELGMEGYVMASADFIKSFDGPLKTLSFTPILLPVYDNLNEDFGSRDKVNTAGKLYFLWYDTDIDLLFMTGGSRSDRFGLDFSRNLTSNFEIHGEFAYLSRYNKIVLTAGGGQERIESEAKSWLLGLRFLTGFDLTAIVEYYHNGTGFSGEELTRYYQTVHQAYADYQSSGRTAALNSLRQLAETGYGRFSAGRDYLYLRLSQKEPFNLLYFTPALTGIMNLNDRSGSLTLEGLYTGFTNWELRLRAGFIMGGRYSEFGEKQNDSRIELRLGYFF
jgi:hypothetical protein